MVAERGKSPTDLTLVTRVIEGAGAIDEIGAATVPLGRRALLVTDAGLIQAGHVERALSSLAAGDVTVEVFSDVQTDPTTEHVERCLAAARAFEPQVLIGMGGGSSIDVARAANFLYCCGGEMKDYWGADKATADLLPFVAVPTTAGTGSEMQSFALIADAETHQKMACGDPRAAARIAVLDPALTLSVPQRVTACAGLDAIGHAVETAVTTARNSFSKPYSLEAFRLAARSFERTLDSPGDLEARTDMLRASALAGRAIENSMLGAAHSLANPLTAHFQVIHGHAVGLMLPPVVRFNSEDAGARSAYAELARSADLVPASTAEHEAAERLARVLEELIVRSGLPNDLATLGITEADCETLAQEAAGQWTAGFNPRTVDVGVLEGLYRSVLGTAG